MALLKVYSAAGGGPPPAGPPKSKEAITDEDLCNALVADEPWAGEVLYDRVEETVDLVLIRVMGPGDTERDDLMQQALEKLVTTVMSGKFERRCSLKSWAALITQHVALGALRTRMRERKVLDRSVSHQALELVAVSGETPERTADVQRRIKTLHAALAATQSNRAEALVLHDLLGHELAEIARLTGVSVAAAQSRLVRGRRDVAEWIRNAEAKSRNGGKP